MFWFWDWIIIAAAAIQGVNGWHRGLLRSWSGIVALVSATILAPYFYTWIAAWLSVKVLLTPIQSSITAYLLTWIIISTLVETLLTQLIQDRYHLGPIWFLDRCTGFCYGLLKTAAVVLLSTIIMLVPIKLPKPPEGKLQYDIPSIVKQPSKVFIPMAMPEAKSLINLKSVRKYIMPQ